MQANTTQIFEATLRITARGYWFTAGGIKGAFGYYPHLRDPDGLPVYPDTQLHGNLKMAARRLAGLGAVEDTLVRELFGTDSTAKDCSPLPSRLFVSDLRLSAGAREQWNSSRFSVTPRIKINEGSRTVARHFLVDLEMAWLDGLELEAKIYIVTRVGNTGSPTQESRLVEEAGRMAGGFGAFRSRGYGRASAMEWSDWQPLTPGTGNRPEITGSRRLALRALTHFRSKTIDPGHAQVLSTRYMIGPDQLKGWLARGYHRLYGVWPTPAQMACLRLSSLYPAPNPGILAWPAPMTSLRDAADSEMTDMWGHDRQSSEENFFTGKKKPLPPDHTVTATGKVWRVQPEYRFRNRTDDSFATTDNGLFVQEFLPAGTIFTGTVGFSGNNREFAGRIAELLLHSPVCINGALFETSLGEPATAPDAEKQEGAPLLVTEPVPFCRDIISENNCVATATLRRYDTVLRRPRRPRVVVRPGSVVTGGLAGTVAWQGFGRKLTMIETEQSGTMPVREQEPPLLVELTRGQKKISRAQAGLLRAMLHPALNSEVVKKNLDYRIEKYSGKRNYDDLKQLLETFRVILKKDGLDRMCLAVSQAVDQLALARWENSRRRKKEQEGAEA
jgi:hypothetical protein